MAHGKDKLDRVTKMQEEAVKNTESARKEVERKEKLAEALISESLKEAFLLAKAHREEEEKKEEREIITQVISQQIQQAQNAGVVRANTAQKAAILDAPKEEIFVALTPSPTPIPVEIEEKKEINKKVHVASEALSTAIVLYYHMELGCGYEDTRRADLNDISSLLSQQRAAMDILGVLHTATLSECNKAYYRLAKIYHTDKGGDAIKFHAISEAINTIRDHYDLLSKYQVNLSPFTLAITEHGEEQHNKEDEGNRPGL